MSLVVGSYADIGLGLLTDRAPKLVVTPSSAMISPATVLLSSAPKIIDYFPNGSWQIELEPNENYRPTTYYTLTAMILDPNTFGPDRGYVHVDEPKFTFVVPDSDSPLFIGTLIVTGLGLGQWWRTTDDLAPAGSKDGDYMWNTVTDDVFEIR